MNKDDIELKSLLDRNACKIEFWFLYWYLLRNKSIIDKNINVPIKGGAHYIDRRFIGNSVKKSQKNLLNNTMNTNTHTNTHTNTNKYSTKKVKQHSTHEEIIKVSKDRKESKKTKQNSQKDKHHKRTKKNN